jgi:Tol biopolymer transport system component
VQADQNPQWSPDGKQIVFGRVEANVSHLYKMAADGIGQMKLNVATQNEGSIAPMLADCVSVATQYARCQGTT